MGCLKTHIEWEPNLRLVYSKKEIKPLKNRINYYPFGLDHNYGLNAPMSIISGRDHKWKYNGQEQMKDLGVNVTEMDWRQYDNALGRFHGIDALAATEPHRTPYHFAGNNPIVFADPSGLKVVANQNNVTYVDAGYIPYDRDTPHWTEAFGIGGGGASSGGGSSSGSNGGITNGFAAIVGLHSDANGNIISNGSYEAIGNGFLSDGTNFVDLFDGEVYDLNPVDIGVVKNRFTGFSDGQTEAIYGSVIGQLSGSNDASFPISSAIGGGLEMGLVSLNIRSYINSGINLKQSNELLKKGMSSYKGTTYLNKYVTNTKILGNIKAANFARVAGKTLGYAGLAVTAYQVGGDLSDGRYASATVRTAIAAIQVGALAFGPAGWVLSAGIGIADGIWGCRLPHK